MAIRNDSFRVVFEVQNDGTIKAAFDGVARQAEQAGQAVDESGQKWYELGQKIGTSLRWAGGIAAAGLALIVHNTIKAEQELAQLDAVLRSTGNAAGYSRDQLVAMADDLSQKSIFSGGDIIEAQTRLLSYSNIVGETFPRAMQAVIDMSARYGMSVTQAAETVGKALQNPAKATQALARQGYEFSDSQIEVMKALQAAGREAEAQAIVLQALEESQEGAAKAARDTLGGALIALKNTLGDLMTGPAGSLEGATQAVNDLIDTLNDPGVREGFSNIVAGVAEVTAEIVQGIGLIGQYIGEWNRLRNLRTGATAPGESNIDDLNTRLGIVGGALRDMDAGRWPKDVLRQGEQVVTPAGREQVRKRLEEERTAIMRAITAAIREEALEVAFKNSPGAEIDFNRPAPMPQTSGSPVEKPDKPTAGRRGMSDAEREAQALARAYESYNLQLLRSNELFEDNSALARLNFEIQYGSLKGLDPVLADHLRMQAEHLDIMEEVAEHERIVNQIGQEHEETIRRQQEAYADLVATLDLEIQLMGMSRVEAKTLLDLRRLGREATEEETAAIRERNQALEDGADVIDAMDALRRSTQGLFQDLMSGTKSWKEAFTDALDSFMQAMQRIIAQKLVEQLFGDYGSTGQGSSGGGFIAQVLGAWLGGGKAYGGETRPNMLHEINELGGPEIFRTRNGRQYLLTGSEHGEVMPLQGAGGAGGDTYNINVPADGIMDYRSRRQYAGDLSKELALSRRNR